jgi:hypothetical protein
MTRPAGRSSVAFVAVLSLVAVAAPTVPMASTATTRTMTAAHAYDQGGAFIHVRVSGALRTERVATAVRDSADGFSPLPLTEFLAAKGLPDNALVVRGGSNTSEVFLKRQHELDANGLLKNSSVNSAPGRSVEELSQGIPHSRIGVTTAGEIRAAGGTIVRQSLPDNPFHCLVSGISPATACGLFTPTIPNPSRRP